MLKNYVFECVNFLTVINPEKHLSIPSGYLSKTPETRKHFRQNTYVFLWHVFGNFGGLRKGLTRGRFSVLLLWCK